MLRLRLDSFPTTRPGQFVQVQCRGLDEQIGSREIQWKENGWPTLTQPELADKEPLLRRPFSLAGRRDVGGAVELDVMVRSVGTGSSWLRTTKTGTKLSLLGPLGNGFTITDAPQAVLVGGGVGIPPMIYLARELAAAGKKVVAFNGSRAKNLLPVELVAGAEISSVAKPTLCVKEFADIGVPSVIATDDGTIGFGGIVTEAFHEWLNANLPSQDELVVCSCGPEPMMRAVAQICLSRGYVCRLALERHMACGMGTCQSCIVKIRDDNEQGWSFKLCCTDGPVFDARDLLW